MANTSKNIATVDANEGQSVSVVGDSYRIIISGEQSDLPLLIAGKKKKILS